MLCGFQQVPTYRTRGTAVRYVAPIEKFLPLKMDRLEGKLRPVLGCR